MLWYERVALYGDGICVLLYIWIRTAITGELREQNDNKDLECSDYNGDENSHTTETPKC